MSATLPKPKEVNYRYEAIIDFMLANPYMKRYEIAESLGYTGAWLSTLTSSDAFRMLYAERRAAYNEDLNDSTVVKIYEVAQKAADKVLDKLEEDECPAGLALDSMTGALKALGFGAPKSQPTTQVNVQQNTYNETDRLALQQARDRLEKVSKMTLIDGQAEAVPAIPALEGE